jgi:hypothetical protein
MNRVDAADCFHLNDNLVLYEQVQTKACIESDAMKRDRDWTFSHNLQAVKSEQVSQAYPIYVFQQPGTEFGVDYQCRSNDFAGDGVDFHASKFNYDVTPTSRGDQRC